MAKHCCICYISLVLVHNITYISNFGLHPKTAIKFDQNLLKWWFSSTFPDKLHLQELFFKIGLYFSMFQACIKLIYAGIIFEKDIERFSHFSAQKSHWNRLIGWKISLQNVKLIILLKILTEKDLWHFDRVSAYFSDASQIFPIHKISLVFFWIWHLMY